MSRDYVKNFIVSDAHEGQGEAIGLSSADIDNVIAWYRSRFGIPGYYLQSPSGSIADVFASSSVNTGKVDKDDYSGYKVLLSRSLNTGNNDDIVFDTKDGNSYKISILLCNGDSLNYVGAKNQQLIFKKSWDEK
jgi:hypothetical protein